MAETKPYNKTLQPILQELHLLLHDLEQDKVRVRTLIKKLHCTELMAVSSGKICRYPICRCGDE